MYDDFKLKKKIYLVSMVYIKKIPQHCKGLGQETIIWLETWLQS